MRFLICSLNSESYLCLSIGVALALREKGHDVAIAADENSVQLLNAQQLTRVPRGPKDGPSFETSMWPQPLSCAIQVKHTEYAIDTFQPDVLICQQLTLGPFIAAERRRLPLAVFGFATYLWPSSPNNRTDAAQMSANPDYERKVWRYQSHLSVLNEVRALFRMTPLELGCNDKRMLGDVFMVRSTAALEGDLAQLPTSVRLVGPCLWERPDVDPELESRLDDAKRRGQAVLFIHQGRFFDQPHFWPKVVDAFAGTDIFVVAASQRMDCPIGDIPPNFYVREWVPQGAVLRHATAVIGSGNTTSVLGTLIAGVPAVLIPAGGEQPDLAERCRSAGVARVVQPNEISSDELRSAVRAVSADANVRNNLQRISMSLAAANNFQKTVDLLEALGSTSQAVLATEIHTLALQASM